MITRAQAEAYRNNPNVQAFLNAISEAEGTTKHGYETAFGGGRLSSLADHPRYLKEFKQTDGKNNSTSAAGRYQFLGSTWDDMAKQLGLRDFGPLSQDLAAIGLLDRAGALNDVVLGDLQTAAKKAGKTWASLPSSPYAQPKKSQAAFDRILAKATGSTLPAMNTDTDTPPASAGGALAPVVQPAGALTGVFDQFSAPAPQVPSYAAALAEMQLPQPQQEEQDSWERALLDSAVDDDAAMARSAALAKFFNEPEVPNIVLPSSIDDTINSYLAKL